MISFGIGIFCRFDDDLLSCVINNTVIIYFYEQDRAKWNIETISL
jgi:hypothetical protein